MENRFFVNAGIPPPLQFGQSLSSPMPSWQSIASAMEIQGTEMNCSPDLSQDCFLNPNSADYGLQFESALSSMVSSPAASNSNISNESFMIRELIGKLGSIGNGGEISPHSQPLLASYINGNNSANTSCYSTPMNSPPKLNLPMMDGLVKEKLPSLGLNSSVAEFAADPGFAERAAKFSCFGSKSFNGRATQFGLNNNTETAGGYGSNSLSRVSSSPSLKAMGSQPTNKNSPLQELANSQEESIISEQNPNQNVDSGNAFKESNPRKRKAVSKAKSKETSSAKDSEPNEKRCKSTESHGKENGSVKAEEEAKGSNGNAEDEKQNKTENKPPEPPKDYIHVRARRGQATDSHSLAERVRREKISERMKLLQNLVPGCNKVTGKALMLDEIINYVQSLQRQVEFLSMKLASVNTRLDFNTDSTSMSKDIFHSNTLPHPIDSSASAFYGHQNPALHANISNGTMTQCSVEPLDTAICTKLNTHLPPTINHFTHTIPQPQYPTFCEGDLQTIVQMGFAQTTSQDIALGSQSFHHSNKE